MIAASQI